MLSENVLKFAKSNVGVYEMFQDYFNNFRSNGGVKDLLFSQVDKEGKAISFAEKESLMNAALKREIFRVAGIQNFDEFPLETWVTNPMLNWATFAVENMFVDMVLPETILSDIGLYCDVKSVGWGDNPVFEIESNGLFTVSRAGRSQKNTQMHKQFKSNVSILPEPRQITTGVSMYSVLSGKESLAKFVAKIILSLESQMTRDVYDAFVSLMTSLPSTTTTGLQVSGYSKASLLRLCTQVEAWTKTKPVIVGTAIALGNVLPDDVNYRYSLTDDYARLGYVRTAFGYDTLVLPQIADWTSQWGRVVSDDYIYVLAPASQKILKLVLEGSTISNTESTFENANLIQRTSISKSYGIGVVTNTTAGIIAL